MRLGTVHVLDQDQVPSEVGRSGRDGQMSPSTFYKWSVIAAIALCGCARPRLGKTFKTTDLGDSRHVLLVYDGTREESSMSEVQIVETKLERCIF